MHEQLAFNQENQDPDWKKVVIVWNANHAKRNENEKISRMFFSTAVYHSIWQSHITQCSNLLTCNAGNANFGKVPKPSENSKKKWIKNTKNITEAHLLHLHALCR